MITEAAVNKKSFITRRLQICYVQNALKDRKPNQHLKHKKSRRIDEYRFQRLFLSLHRYTDAPIGKTSAQKTVNKLLAMPILLHVLHLFLVKQIGIDNG